MKFRSLKFIISMSTITILTLFIVIITLYLKSQQEYELYKSMENNALNLLNATKNNLEIQHLNIVNFKKYVIESRKQELVDNMSIVFSMIDDIYYEYKSGRISEEEAKRHALKEIKNIRYNNSGYFWINNTGQPFPKMIMHPTIPELDGKVLSYEKFDTALGKQKNLFKSFVDLCLKNGSGFVNYSWPKLVNNKLTENKPKISYVKIFKPWNWIIGTGVYLDDIDQLIDKKMKDIANNLNQILLKQKVGKNGYFFIFDEDYNFIVHPLYAGKNGNELVNPSSSKMIMSRLRKTAFTKTHILDYYWNRIDDKDNYTYHKKAFVDYYKPLKWYIASSIYIDDYKENITKLSNNLIIFSLFFILISLILSILLSKKITDSLYLLIKALENKDENGIPKKIYFNTKIIEFRNIAESFNNLFKMIKKSQKEKQQLELQLNQSRKMDAIGQLAGGIAHDFNNVLTGIINATQLLKSSNNDFDEDSNKLIDMILLSSERAAKLTSNLLSFSRKGKVISKSLNINTIIEDSIEILSKTINKKISITFKKEAEVCEIIGDDSQLQNIFINLGINSSHAIINNGKIIFETKNVFLDENYIKNSSFDIESGKYIKITVKDTGTGIKEDIINKIFEPFFTTKEEGRGTGLGLTAVYGAVVGHKGVIEVSSKVGLGTSFNIYLPCSKSEKDNEKKNIDLKDKYENKEIKGTVLIVDDEEVIRITEEHILKKIGYTVLTAENGKKAVEIFKKYCDDIDIVIMDMIMPEMNGSEAFYKIKEIKNDVKVIISSGFTKDENLERLKKDGLSGVLEKPFSISELVKVLNSVL